MYCVLTISVSAQFFTSEEIYENHNRFKDSIDSTNWAEFDTTIILQENNNYFCPSFQSYPSYMKWYQFNNPIYNNQIQFYDRRYQRINFSITR